MQHLRRKRYLIRCKRSPQALSSFFKKPIDVRSGSKLTAELLSSLVEETNQKIAQAETALQAANAHYQDVVSSSKQAEKEYGQLLTWADIYERCTFAEKKMIVANLIKKVTVGRDYKIEIEFNFTYDEFQKFSRSRTAEL